MPKKPRISSYLTGNWRLKCDYLFGTRAASLILYGALPSSLAALGALKVPDLQAQPTRLLLPMVVVAVVPFVVLFLLIRQRLKVWYLMAFALPIRSVILTLAIVILSTGVCLAATLIKPTSTNDGKILPPTDWTALTKAQRYALLQQSFLLALVVLVASSTLFLTALKDKGALPGLPPAQFLVELTSLRNTMVKIHNAPIWADGKADSETLKTDIETARDSLEELMTRSRATSGRARFFRRLHHDLQNLEQARMQVAESYTRWSDLFDSTSNSERMSSDDKSLRSSMKSIQELRCNA